jgi:hypothetical protein
MESKKINQLATELAPVLSDLTIIGDPSTGISKKITLSQMASLFTGTVEEYPNLASFPLVGTADTIYIALDTNIIYRWNTGTNAYVELSPNIVTSLVFNDANGFDGTISLVGSTATLTITTALTQGSVPFIGTSGALTQDNANLFFDDTNNRLGINTNSPTTALDVFGSGIIGRVNGTSTNNAFLGFASAGSNKWSIGNVQSDHRFRIFSETNTSELVSVLQTGEFGIGIANPTTKLHIDGGASALIANLDANVSVAKSISFRSDNSNRINLEVSGTESGSNAGMDLQIKRFSDAGALIDTALYLQRSTGNISIGGVTLASWFTGYIAMQLGASASIYGNKTIADTNTTQLANNAYLNTAASAWQYINTDEATRYEQVNGNHDFYSVASGSAGSNITWPPPKMTITLAGNVGIGTTSPSYKLHIIESTTNGRAVQGVATATSGTNYGGVLVAEGIGATKNIGLYASAEGATTNVAAIFDKGNVGIGTSSPDGRLTIKQANSLDYRGLLVVDSATPNWIGLAHTGSAGVISVAYDGAGSYTPMIFKTSDAEKVRITTGGYLKASNTGSYLSSTGSWHEFTSNNATNFVLAAYQTSLSFDNAILYIRSARNTVANNYYAIQYYHEGAAAVKFQVADSGNVTNTNNSYGAISDIKLKENITDATPKLDDLLKVKVKNFNFIGSEEKQLGVIAQELEEIFPSMIDESEDFEEVEVEGEDGEITKEKKSLGTITKSVKYSVFVPMLIKAIQEQQAQIEELKTLINK